MKAIKAKRLNGSDGTRSSGRVMQFKTELNKLNWARITFVCNGFVI